jgi:hypothetical protein
MNQQARISDDLNELTKKMAHDIKNLRGDRTSDTFFDEFVARRDLDLKIMSEMMRFTLQEANSVINLSKLHLILKSEAGRSTGPEHDDLVRKSWGKIVDVARGVYADVFPAFQKLAADRNIASSGLQTMVEHFHEKKELRRKQLEDRGNQADDFLSNVSMKIGKQEIDKFYSQLVAKDMASALVIAANKGYSFWRSNEVAMPAPKIILEGADYLAGKALELQSHLDAADITGMQAIQGEWAEFQPAQDVVAPSV